MSAVDRTKFAYWIGGVLLTVILLIAKSYAAGIDDNATCIQELKEVHNMDMRRIETNQSTIETNQAVAQNELSHIRTALIKIGNKLGVD